MKSAQPSGRTSVTDGCPAGVTLTHRQVREARRTAGGSHSRYPGCQRAPAGLICPILELPWSRDPTADSFKTAGASADGMGGMEQTPDLTAAAKFVAASGRVLDQRRFELLLHGGDTSAVLAAV